MAKVKSLESTGSESDADLVDVFVSHAWKDKEAYIEPLVVSLQEHGLTCWYDLAEIRPGDSLVEQLNHGLTHSKVLLLCLSDAYLQGKWAVEELKAAVGLGVSKATPARVVPIMICDPLAVAEKYPIPFAHTLYIAWDADVGEMAKKIRAMVAAIDEADHAYWLMEGQRALEDGNTVRAVIYATRAQEAMAQDGRGLILQLAAWLQRGESDLICERIRALWPGELLSMDFRQVDMSALASMVRDLLAAGIAGQLDRERVPVQCLLQQLPDVPECWKLLSALCESGWNSEELVGLTTAWGKSDTLDWALDRTRHERDKRCREKLVESLIVLLAHNVEEAVRIREALQRLARDRNERVRRQAIMALWCTGDRDVSLVQQALCDRSSEVRMTGVGMALGEFYSVNVEGWSEVGISEGPAHPCTKESAFWAQVLADPDPMLVEGMMDAITSGELDLPKGFDPTSVERELVDRDELRANEILSNDLDQSGHAELVSLACSSRDPFMRARIYKGLEEDAFALDDASLRNLFERECDSSADGDLMSLVLEKGSDDLSDVLVRVVDETIGHRNDKAEFALARLLRGHNRGATEEALDLVESAGAQAALSPLAGNLARAGYSELAERSIRLGLNDKHVDPRVLLAVGLVEAIPVADLEPFVEGDDWILMSAGLRALAVRDPSGGAQRRITEVVDRLMGKATQDSYKGHWGLLEAIDGLLEVQGRGTGLGALQRFLSIVDAMKSTTLVRHEVFTQIEFLERAPAERVDWSLPYRWRFERGPFFGIKID